MNAYELATAIGMNLQTVYSWNRMGYLNPGHIPAESGGTTRSKACSYSPVDVAVAARMAAMVKSGLTHHAAHAVARGDVRTANTIITAIEGVTLEPILEPTAGDEPVAERAAVDAMDIAVAVRDVDPRDLWVELEAMRQDEPHRMLAAVVALAAMVPIETPVSELLAWTDDLVVKGAA